MWLLVYFFWRDLQKGRAHLVVAHLVLCCSYGQHAVKLRLTAVCLFRSPTMLWHVVPYHCAHTPYAAYSLYCCRYGQDEVVKKLTAVCPVDVSKSTKLQDAQWIGQVLSAARTGDAAAMKTLLAQDRAKARLRKLHKPVEVRCPQAFGSLVNGTFMPSLTTTCKPSQQHACSLIHGLTCNLVLCCAGPCICNSAQPPCPGCLVTWRDMHMLSCAALCCAGTCPTYRRMSQGIRRRQQAQP